MSFLDNLENNLKALESQDNARDDKTLRYERERERRRAIGPWAERLKEGSFAKGLMQQATLAGRQRRMKVNLMWLGDTLRLEARGQRLELQPGADGVSAVFLRDWEELRRERVDLAGDPGALAGEWMAALDEQRRREEQAAMESEDDGPDE